MLLDPKPAKTIHVRGDRNPYLVTGGQKTQISVLACVSAAGQCLPPMIICMGSPELVVEEVSETIYRLSKKGWMDQELFEKWFSRHFLRYPPSACPLLVMLDGHSSLHSGTNGC